MSKREIYFFNKAKEVSKLSDFNKIHIGAIAVYKNNIISIGYNSYKTHPMQKKYDRYRKMYANKGVEPPHCTHAEFNCLNNIKKLDLKWERVKIYVYRENAKKDLAMCRPCKSCMKMIDDLGIKKIFYTTDGGFANETRF